MWNSIQGGWFLIYNLFFLLLLCLRQHFLVGSEPKGMDRYMLKRGRINSEPVFCRLNPAALENIRNISQPSIVCWSEKPPRVKRLSITVSSIISILCHARTKQQPHSGWALYKDGRWSRRWGDPQHSSFVYRRIHDFTYS